MSAAARPGCRCSDCLAEDEVYHLVCHDCANEVKDALEFHDHFIAGKERAESLAESHWHENVEVGLVWRVDDA